MDEIEQLIYEHRQSLKNEVEAEINQMIIANELVRLFPMTHGGMDKTHIVWSRALRDTLWLGWLSEAKCRRGAYDDKICNAIKDSLTQAFEIGRRHAEEQP